MDGKHILFLCAFILAGAIAHGCECCFCGIVTFVDGKCGNLVFDLVLGCDSARAGKAPRVANATGVGVVPAPK